MLLRGPLVGAAVAGGLLLCVQAGSAAAEGFEPSPPAARGKSVLQIAPLSLGGSAAAKLQTRSPVIPIDTRAQNTESFRYRHPLTAKNGDTLSGLLVGAGVDRRDAADAIDAMRDVFDPRRIRTGQEVTLLFERFTHEPEPGRFMGFSMLPDFKREVAVARTPDGFEARESERQLTRAPVRASGRIDSSLYADGEKAGVPIPVLAELIRAYSWDVDFQRDIWPGDSFEIMWQRVYDDSGNLVHNGEILYANLTLTGTTHPIYRFEVEDGHFDYFNEQGQSARKALMRTPIDGARLSSRYGKRRHPILGYNKMHRGVDFAAPKGTPIYAAGDGRIELSGWNGAYGKYVRIRHNSEYSTAYGHMSRIARSAGKGKRVRQGQIIGYVGNTGRSTGAHLHYEILRGGRQTNPLKVRMPSGRKLKGEMLARFQEARSELDLVFASLTDEIELAGGRD